MENGVIPAEDRHLDGMVPIFVAGQAFHYGLMPDIFAPPADTEAVRKYLRNFLPGRNPFRKRETFALVWLVDGRVSGYLLYELRLASSIFFQKGIRNSFIVDISIAEDRRQQGGATTLFAVYNDLLKEKGVQFANAQVWCGNDASHALFRKQGYACRSQNYFRTGS